MYMKIYGWTGNRTQDSSNSSQELYSYISYPSRQVIFNLMFCFFAANLMRLMNALSQDSQVSPRMSFIINFVREAINCGSQNAKFTLQFMPPQMVCETNLEQTLNSINWRTHNDL